MSHAGALDADLASLRILPSPYLTKLEPALVAYLKTLLGN